MEGIVMSTETTQTAGELLQFIDKSPTCYHAVKNVGQQLEEEGFVAYKESDSKEQLADKGFFIRNDSSLIAYRLPKNPPKGTIVERPPYTE